MKITSNAAATWFALLLAACASSSANDASPIKVHIVDTNITSDIRFAGPVAIRFRVEIENPTKETVTLRKIEIHTTATGAFSVRATNNYSTPIAPAQVITQEIHANGTSAGGRFASDEPVVFHGSAYFDSPHGAFVKMFEDVLRVQ